MTDVPEITVPSYRAPEVTIEPVTEVIPSEPIDGRPDFVGHYQSVLLDVRSGALSFHESTQHREPWDESWTAVNSVPREIWERWHPGTLFTPGGQWFKPVPDRLTWVIDSGFSKADYFGVREANAFLKQVAPLAQTLLDGLFEAAGELDWSAASVRAGRQLARVCQLRKDAEVLAGPDASLVDYGEVVRRFPQVYRPHLLGQTLDEVAEECETISRFLGSNEHWHEEVKKIYGVPSGDGTVVYLDVLGVRAWYRTLLIGDDPRPVISFEDWDRGRVLATGRSAMGTLGGIASSTSDAELAEWAHLAEATAAREGVRLLGALDAATRYRAELRDEDWDRLAVVGAEVDRLERELADARSARLDLVNRAIGWGRSDSAIAERGRMTRQAVNKIRPPQSGG